MKTIFNTIALFALLAVNQVFAQDVTTVRANNRDISDNLDLKAVASIFGDSKDLEDFERRLNDPQIQISNLDLNGDNRVDYLRVIEAKEGNTHLIILQAVIGADTFQDVATIEVERDRNNNVQVQVVGDVYMYGPNYIYEPVYVTRPVLFDVFWVSTYRPYYSPWYWGYYPRYYSYWAPYPVYRYRNNIHVHINNYNHYNYVNTRRSSRAVAMYDSRRSNAYERQYPNRSFTQRTNVSNRYALEQTRVSNRGQAIGQRATATQATRNNASTGLRSGGTRDVNSNQLSRSNNVRNTTTQDAGNNGRLINSTRNSNAAPAVRNNNNVVRDNSNVVRTPGNLTRTQSETRLNTTPARSSGFDRANTTAPVRNVQQPMRSNATPQMRNNPAPAQQRVQSTPAPQMRSTPAPQMRSNPAPAQQQRMQSAPSRSGGEGGGRRG